MGKAEEKVLRNPDIGTDNSHELFNGWWINAAGLFLLLAFSLAANKTILFSEAQGKHGSPESAAPASAAVKVPDLREIIKKTAVKYDLDPKLIASIILVESRGDVTALSPKGAKGLMQLMPGVCRQYGVSDPFDMEQNINVGSAYLAHLINKFDGNLSHALAAYNCGPTRVIKYKGIPPITETRRFVRRVHERYGMAQPSRDRWELPSSRLNHGPIATK